MSTAGRGGWARDVNTDGRPDLNKERKTLLAAAAAAGGRQASRQVNETLPIHPEARLYVATVHCQPARPRGGQYTRLHRPDSAISG